MEAEKIISTIKEQIGTTDFSDRTIASYVESNPIEEGNEPDENYFSKGANFFKSLQGQYNSDLSSKLNTQVEEFKKTYKPDTLEKPDGSDGNKGDDKYNELLEKFNSLSGKFEEKEKFESQRAYKQNLQEKFKAEVESKKLVFDPVYYKFVETELGDIDTQKDVNTILKDITPKYEKLLTENNRNGGSPANGGFSATAQDGKKMLEDYFAKKKAQEGWGNK
jgi:hypothetical protein